MRSLLLVLATASVAATSAQDDLAYMGTRPKSGREAPVQRLSILDGALPGSKDLELPDGTVQVDLLNGNGRVTREFTGPEMDRLDIAGLRPGTWTLRAHTASGMVVRRFMVMQGGHVWTLDQLPAKNQRRTRAPLD